MSGKVYLNVGSVFRRSSGHAGPIEIRPEWAPSRWEALVIRVVDTPGILSGLRDHFPDQPIFREWADHPDIFELAAAVRECADIPAELREAVANRMESPPRGRPRKGNSITELAAALRECPGPHPGAIEYVTGRLGEAIAYLAGRLEGLLKPSKRPGSAIVPPSHAPEKDPFAQHGNLALLKLRVRLLHAAFRIQGIRNPYGTSLWIVAKASGREPETIERKLKGLPDFPTNRPNPPTAPWDLPISQLEKTVRKMVGEGGRYSLDPIWGLVPK